MNLLLDEIAKAVDGTLDGPKDATALGYSIDSRTLNAGDLFIAIPGPRFDGHNFVRPALEKKAVGAIVEHARIDNSVVLEIRNTVPNAAFIRVKSTQAALQDLARHVRRSWGMRVIGVTGSAGKTTTKEMIAAVLSKRFSVLRTAGNFNNEIGLPLTLLRIERSQNIAVLEMGMSAKGEIRKLASIAEPNEGVITNVNPVHLEFFKSVDEIAEAKAELLEGLVAPRRGYLNNDDPRVAAMARKFDGKTITYGIHSAADFKAGGVQDLGLSGTSFTVQHAGSSADFVLPLPGGHNVANALAAVAVGVTNEIPLSDVQEAISAMKPEKMRGEIIRFREGFIAIDDSYNSNPKALTEMIRFFGNLSGFERRIAVLGEMLELGPQSADLHRECGKEAADAGFDCVIAVQGMAGEILEGARAAGMSGGRLEFAADSAKAGELLVKMVKKGDAILLKASHGVRLDRALDSLRAAFMSVEP